jgi:uracil-DNA glycosylase
MRPARARARKTTSSTGSAADFIPPRPTLPTLRAAAASCRGCDLWLNATQTVFGEGPRGADVMFVGEQPGDQEDLKGHPFVGPAGRLLDAALEEAGIDRRKVYVTNAVKHFKFVRKELTRRRLHKKPSAGEVRACNPWLQEEIRLVHPKMIVALGSTAAQALLGSSFRVTEKRGRLVQSDGAGPVLATVHPSSVLRAPDEAREQARREFFRDIKRAAEALAGQR